MANTASAFDLVSVVAEELSLAPDGVRAVVELLEGGATVPFIARYRKEVTGGLDEVEIRNIDEKRGYVRELEERRQAILRSIEEQGKLTDALRDKIAACREKQVLEDLYLPFKPKRRTKATIAREAGLAPLAERILSQPADGDPQKEAESFLGPEKEGLPGTAVESVDQALAGAREIIGEQVIEHAETRAALRAFFLESGQLKTEKVPSEKSERSKFEDYFDYSEAAKTIPSHRYLAIRRGETEGELRSKIEIDADAFLPRIESAFALNAASPFASELRLAIKSAFRRRLALSVETDVRLELKARADRQAVEVFAENLENLLLSPPYGAKSVIGIDPGLRTGCKCAALDDTGKYLENITIYPLRGRGDEAKASEDLLAFVRKHTPRAIAIGNGTGGRETEKFVKGLLREHKITDILVVSVSEAGASVYSASDVAREEFPDLDLTIRGAISIARRLQDPLAELVKIDPKSIGVGQYQHDVQQTMLQKKLHEVVESCVNRVGVELNTASAPLLSYVAGLGPSLARKVVAHRDQVGVFRDRRSVLDVSGLGPKAFEQAGGFLRVEKSQHPLDNSAVHPERYALVERIAKDMGVELRALVGDAALVSKIDIARYVGEGVGEATLKDILDELKKPGRDPRKAFETANFREDVNELSDLEVGMKLEGVVTNVTAFGAFVDIGVHQDGLVHISELADTFVKDPKDVVKVGQRLNVRVMEVDLERKRIALSARSSSEGRRAAAPSERTSKPNAAPNDRRKSGDRGRSGGRGRDDQRPQRDDGFANNPFASALKRRG